jgi:hypothetical protein
MDAVSTGRLLVSDAASATDLSFIKTQGVTHVVNATETEWDGRIDNVAEQSGVAYFNVRVWDRPDWSERAWTAQRSNRPLAQPVRGAHKPIMTIAGNRAPRPARLYDHFDPVVDFVAAALELSRDGRVLVHCQQGKSRSVSLVLPPTQPHIRTHAHQHAHLAPCCAACCSVLRCRYSRTWSRKSTAHSGGVTLANYMPRILQAHCVPMGDLHAQGAGNRPEGEADGGA